MGDDALAVVADELYGLPAAEFTAARNARAKATKATDRSLSAAIAALPRPSAAAWVLNQLVRQRAGDVEALLELGGRLRAAHAALDAEAIRALGKERHQQIAALARAARELAVGRGQSVSAAVEREIEDTLGAAVATVEAGEAVRSGRLTKALSYAGFGEVDLTGVLAVPGRVAPVRAAPEEPPEPVEEPEPDPAVRRRERKLAEQRERELSRARTAVVDAQERLTAAHAAAQELRAQLERAEQRVEKAQAAAREVGDRLAELEAQRAD